MFLSLILAISLAIDAFCVAVSLSASSTISRTIDKLKVSISFAIFQGLMPVIGMIIILPIQNYLGVVNILGFVFLIILGAKMIKESFDPLPNLCENSICRLDGCCEEVCKNTGKNRYLKFKDLLVYSVATSIDALLAGAIIVTLDVDLKITILFITVVTFVLSVFGSFFASRLKVGFEKKAEFLGGVILILLAVKTIVELF